jgi:hypothetical protein
VIRSLARRWTGWQVPTGAELARTADAAVRVFLAAHRPLT